MLQLKLEHIKWKMIKLDIYDVDGNESLYYNCNISGKIQCDKMYKTFDFNKGWVSDNGKWYYLDKNDGVMETGSIQIDRCWYYLDKSGAMYTGWILYNNKWYYLYKDGTMAVKTKIGKWIYCYP